MQLLRMVAPNKQMNWTQPKKQEWTTPERVDLPESFKWAAWKEPPAMYFGAAKVPDAKKEPIDFTQVQKPKPVFRYFTTAWDPPEDPAWLTELIGILSRISVRGHRYPLVIEWSGLWSAEGSAYYGSINVKMNCKDRRTPEWDIWVSNPLPIPKDITVETVTAVVREGIKSLMTHEVDECLHFDGVRKWDPHAMPF